MNKNINQVITRNYKQSIEDIGYSKRLSFEKIFAHTKHINSVITDDPNIN